MYHDEIHHRGRPHFHATYGGDEASIDIEDLAVIAGHLPPRAKRLVLEWALEHRPELSENWQRARRHERSSPSSLCGRRSTIGAMRSTPLLVEAAPLDGYTVHVRFEDGVAADVDLSYLVQYGGVFEPLRDLGFFRQLRADPDAGTI